MDAVINEFSELSVPDQLTFLERLLQVSKPEVKYNFQHRVCEITTFDIIKELPLEVVELILLYLDLNTLLSCRAVSRQWLLKVNNSNRVWTPLLSKHCININEFNANICTVVTRKSYPSPRNKEDKSQNLQVIGENMFSMLNTSNNSINSTIGLCDASHFIMGKKILASLANQAFFQRIVDHDFRGSNIVMAMNEEILAYGKIIF